MTSPTVISNGARPPCDAKAIPLNNLHAREWPQGRAQKLGRRIAQLFNTGFAATEFLSTGIEGAYEESLDESIGRRIGFRGGDARPRRQERLREQHYRVLVRDCGPILRRRVRSRE